MKTEAAAPVTSCVRSETVSVGTRARRGAWAAGRIALAAVIAIAASASASSAIDFPLTRERAKAAVSAGEAATFSVIARDERYQAEADKETALDLRRTCDVLTPFRTIALRAAEAHAKYATVSPQVVRDAVASHSFDVSVHLFSTVHGMNTDAVGVIKQGTTLLHAAHRTYIEKDRLVASDPVGYQQLVSFEFDLRRFHPNAPFTVTIANVVTRAGVGEFSCAFDGSAFP